MNLDVIGKVIKNVIIYKDEFNFYNEINIIFEDVFVSICVNIDTDELIIDTHLIDEKTPYCGKFSNQIENDSFSKIVKTIVGKIICSYWIAENNMGYLDLFALGIEDMMPNYIVSCAASQLQIRWMCNENNISYRDQE